VIARERLSFEGGVLAAHYGTLFAGSTAYYQLNFLSVCRVNVYLNTQLITANCMDVNKLAVQ